MPRDAASTDQASMLPAADQAGRGLRPTRADRLGRWADPVVAACCLLLVAVIHPVGPLLRQPYWLDEAWVAVSAKAGWLELPWMTASSPLGWTVLVSSLPAYGQIQRLIPLVFLAGSVVAGYAFGRALGWSSRARSIVAGSAGALAALLLPAQAMRHDLKQYTADAAVALLLLTLAAWAESTWSPRRLVTLGGGIVIGMLFSHPAALVGGAVLGGLLLAAAASRHGARLRLVGAVVAATGLGTACVYLLVDRAGRTSGLSSYWSGYFPSITELPGYLGLRLDQLRPALGLGWPWFLGLVILGVVTVARSRRPATATALVLLPTITLTAGVLRLYPLLDQRTSHFLLVTAAVLAAIGVAGAAMTVATAVASVAARTAGTGATTTAEAGATTIAEAGGKTTAGTTAGRTAGVVQSGPAGWARSSLRRVAGRPAGMALSVVLLAMAGFAVANGSVLRQPPLTTREDVRAQVSYLAAHRGPGDTVLVNLSGQYGFAYYWSGDEPRWHRGGVQATGFQLDYPPAARIVVATDRDQPSVVRALATAEGLTPAGGRIWLVRTHLNEDETRAWQAALAGRVVRVFTVGPEPLTMITPN